MVNKKNINTYQNKRHKQIMIIFVDFRENIEIKTKLWRIKKIFERTKNEVNKTTKKNGSNVQIKTEP